MHLLKRRNDAGYWGTAEDIFKWLPRKGTTFWVLGVLADLGLTRKDSGLERACEYVLGTRLSCGAFGLRPPPKPYECFTGVLAGALARLGYLGDERLEGAYRWLVSRQRADGGFWCKDTGQPGRPRQEEPSCALGSLLALSALAAHPALGKSRVSARCRAFLLGCWDLRGKIKYAGHDSDIGSGWEKLKYPFNDYRILHYLDIISSVPAGERDSRIADILSRVMSRRDEQGRFHPESITRAWSEFDFGQKKRASRWLTYMVYRTAVRLGPPFHDAWSTG